MFDREKYLALVKTHGLPAALSALHQDIERLEFETFEGREGWRPELFEELKKIRSFSRELWDSQLRQ